MSVRPMGVLPILVHARAAQCLLLPWRGLWHCRGGMAWRANYFGATIGCAHLLDRLPPCFVLRGWCLDFRLRANDSEVLDYTRIQLHVQAITAVTEDHDKALVPLHLIIPQDQYKLKD